ncbi:MAG: hypothetical protein JWQ98_1895 [Chlorobi bacterium]|nr:hypothetical protein [Chlorobiota bacterium]
MNTTSLGESKHKYLFQLIDKGYERELNLKNEITSRTNTLLSIFTLVAAIVAYYATNIPVGLITPMHWVVYGLLVLTGLAGVIAVCYIRRFLIGHKYGYMPDAANIRDQYDELLAHKDEIQSYNDQLPIYNASVDASKQLLPEIPIEIESEMDVYLIEQYCKAAATNSSKNKLRADLYSKAIGWLTTTAAMSLLVAAPFFIIKATVSTISTTPPTSISPTYPTSRDSSMAKKNVPDPQPPEKPVKPEPKPLRLITESDTSKPKKVPRKNR